MVDYMDQEVINIKVFRGKWESMGVSVRVSECFVVHYRQLYPEGTQEQHGQVNEVLRIQNGHLSHRNLNLC